jgi:hypothetical protein
MYGTWQLSTMGFRSSEPSGEGTFLDILSALLAITFEK